MAGSWTTQIGAKLTKVSLGPGRKGGKDREEEQLCHRTRPRQGPACEL